MKTLDSKTALRSIPPINQLLDSPDLAGFLSYMSRARVLQSLRQSTEQLKSSLLSDPDYLIRFHLTNHEDVERHLVGVVKKDLDRQRLHLLQQVINATGIVLHTNLGRAPLPEKALEKVMEISSGYSNLEYDLEKGTRGSRYDHMEELLCQLTGAQSALVVNNNAAAVFLCLNTFARDKEVIVSRGEQVEIGGSFRIPDIIRESGCLQREVGTTNKTRPRDYEEAITDETAMLLKVHTSNYKIIGFVSSVSWQDMNTPKDRGDILRMEDLGSGCLVDMDILGLPAERTPMDALKEGAHLVTFSGDKLLGGSQAGIILGKRHLIEKIKENPLTRIVRCDKMTIAALHSVLHTYAASADPVGEIPALSMLSQRPDFLEKKARVLHNILTSRLADKCSFCVVDVEEEAGGGSLPGVALNGKAVAAKPQQSHPEALRVALRTASRPIVCRIQGDHLLFHVRTLDKDQFAIIAEELEKALEEKR